MSPLLPLDYSSSGMLPEIKAEPTGDKGRKKYLEKLALPKGIAFCLSVFQSCRERPGGENMERTNYIQSEKVPRGPTSRRQDLICEKQSES